jgi:hypothetical protein
VLDISESDRPRELDRCSGEIDASVGEARASCDSHEQAAGSEHPIALGEHVSRCGSEFLAAGTTGIACRSWRRQYNEVDATDKLTHLVGQSASIGPVWVRAVEARPGRGAVPLFDVAVDRLSAQAGGLDENGVLVVDGVDDQRSGRRKGGDDARRERRRDGLRRSVLTAVSIGRLHDWPDRERNIGG